MSSDRATPNMDQLLAHLDEQAKQSGIDEQELERVCAYCEWVFDQIGDQIIETSSIMLAAKFKDSAYVPTGQTLDIAATAVAVAAQATLMVLVEKAFIRRRPMDGPQEMPDTYMKIKLDDFFGEAERRTLIDGFDALLDVIHDSPNIPPERIVRDILHTLRTGEI